MNEFIEIRWLRVKEFAKQINFAEKTVRKWIRNGKIQARFVKSIPGKGSTGVMYLVHVDAIEFIDNKLPVAKKGKTQAARNYGAIEKAIERGWLGNNKEVIVS